MAARRPPETGNEEFWRDFLTRGHSLERIGRKIFIRIPTDPRCKLCAAPFSGVGAPLMRLLGKRQSDASPSMCNSCFNFMAKHRGGAEVEGSFLFADIRGSTALAESMSPGEFHRLLDRFYAAVTQVVYQHDGAVDKFVGDELVANFFPLLSGERHTTRAVDAARAILRATGHDQPDGPWVPVGVGVHAGPAWFGAVGEGTHIELTALGDTVNTAARLGGAAAAGEVLVSANAAAAAGLDGGPDAGLERRSLELKGKAQTVEAVSLRVGPTAEVVSS